MIWFTGENLGINITFKGQPYKKSEDEGFMKNRMRKKRSDNFS